MSDHFDDDRRALARCEADYLREPERTLRDTLIERHLPDDPAACSAAHVRAEVDRISRLRDDYDDEDSARDAEIRLAWYLLRAIAAEGHPLARAATEVTP